MLRRLQLVNRAPPQGVITGAFERRENRALVAETNLALGRMHIDIDLGWIDGEIEHRQRKAVWLPKAAIGLFDGERQVAMVDTPPIEQDHDVIAGAAVQRRRADQPCNARPIEPAMSSSPPWMRTRYPSPPSRRRLTASTSATAAMLARASPRKPSVLMLRRSSSVWSLLVACR